MTQKPERAHNRTDEDFSKFLGNRPERLGVVSRMEPYEQFTASYLTEAVGNVYQLKEKSDKYQKIDSLSFSWDIEQNKIQYAYFADDVVQNGLNGSEITMAFTKREFEAEETFMIDGSKQMCWVVEAPTRRADDYWEYQVRLMSGDREAVLDTSVCKKGMKARWIGSAKPELHDTGFVKFQSNAESMQQYITEIRCDIDFSSRYEALEKMYIKISRGTEMGKWQSKIFEWPERKKVLLDTFMATRNQGMLWQHGTMDEKGRSTLTDRMGRPIIAGDGIIPQINRFASKFNYTTLDLSLFNTMLTTLARKCKNTTGNTFQLVVNDILWMDLQNVLGQYLADNKTDGAYLWSKQTNGNIKAGATYDAYTFGGNTLIIHVDRALSLEYGEDKGYGILIDLTGDKASGRPAIEMFTLEGKQLVEDTVTGVGLRGGEVATKVAGGSFIMSGYWGVAVYNPYRSCILMQN
jgi:hypothetical protein